MRHLVCFSLSKIEKLVFWLYMLRSVLTVYQHFVKTVLKRVYCLHVHWCYVFKGNIRHLIGNNKLKQMDVLT